MSRPACCFTTVLVLALALTTTLRGVSAFEESLNSTEFIAAEGIGARFPLEPKAYAECHNITGTCLSHGFVCASEQVVPHSKRCDGVEDCRDGTDEFMCEHELKTPLAEASHEVRRAHEQATCVNCNCRATTIPITSSMGWFQFARLGPCGLSWSCHWSSRYGLRWAAVQSSLCDQHPNDLLPQERRVPRMAVLRPTE
jgi:hypothetical protein